MSDTETRLQRMEQILGISRELTSTVSQELLLHKIIQAAVELTHSESAGILLLDEHDHELRFVAVTSFAEQLVGVPVPIEGSIAGATFSSGQPLIVDDPQADPRYYRVVEERIGFKARSLLAVPLQFRTHRIGVLEVENKRGDEKFDQDDVQMLSALAGQATIAIESARLVEELRKAQDELERRVEERTAELSEANVALQKQITERRQAEEQLKAALAEKEVLLREIHHRVKNNLQVVSVLLELQSEATENEQARQALQEGQYRIQSMASIHEQLYRSHSLGQIEMESYIRDLIGDLRQAYGAYDIALWVDAAGIVMNIDVAIPCGMVINELVSNSIKHAFPPGESLLVGSEGQSSRQTAQVCVTLRPSPADAGMFELAVADNGTGLPDDVDLENSRSLGLRLIRILARQLRGSLKVDRAEGEGTVFKVTFPALVQGD